MAGMGMPMLVMGDFHCILDATEKRGGLPFRADTSTMEFQACLFV